MNISTHAAVKQNGMKTYLDTLMLTRSGFLLLRVLSKVASVRARAIAVGEKYKGRLRIRGCRHHISQIVD